MHYYVLRVQRKKDGTEVRNIAPFDNHDSAEIHYHKCLANDMGNADMVSVLCAIIVDYGMDGSPVTISDSKTWHAPTEPNETE